MRIAGLGFGDMVAALRNDGHPALYYLLLGWWMDVVGQSDVAVRAFSAVASLATVPVLWAIGRRRSETLAVLAALIGLSSPFLLRYGTEARMYALLTFFVALAWLAVERALERPDPGRLAVVAAVTAALIHTHYWSFWLIGATLLMGATATVFGEPDRRRSVIRTMIAVSAGAATFVVWLGVFFDQLGSTGTPWADRARPAEIAIEAMQALGGNNRFEGELLGLLVVVLALLGAFGTARGDVVELRFGLGPLSIAAVATVATLAIGGGVALVTAGAFEGRYTAVVVPFVLVLAARGLAQFPAGIGLVTTAVVVVFGLAIGADEARRDRTQAGDVAAAIAAGAQPGDVVAFCPDQVGPATRHALDAVGTRAPLDAFAYPRGDGTLVNWSDYAEVIEAAPPEDFVDRVVASAGGNDVWLVTGLGYKSLGNRCETIIEILDRTRRPDRIISPSTVFEPMLLTRYEAAG